MRIEGKKDISELVERGLGSPGKLKILKLLLGNPTHLFTRYEIGKKIPLRPVDIRTNLNILVDLGWVKKLTIQPRKYSINLEDAVVTELRKFFKSIRYCR